MIRQEYEKSFIQNKKRDMDRELDDIKFKNEIANKRNENLINEINKNTFRLFSENKNPSNTVEFLRKEKNKNDDFSYNHLNTNTIKKDYFSRLQMKQYEILNLKNTFENQIEKNEEVFKLESLYNERMKKMMNDFSQNMSSLNERNMKIANEREEIIKNYIDLENKTYEAINKIMEENVKMTENKRKSINKEEIEKLVDKCIYHINSKIEIENESNLDDNDIINIIEKRLKEEELKKTIKNEEEKIRNFKKNEENDNQNYIMNGKMQYILDEKIRESKGKFLFYEILIIRKIKKIEFSQKN
jgi:hypothetical protein